MDKIRNLSVKKSVIFYMTVSLICSFLLSGWVIYTASEVQKQVWWKYVDKDEYYEMVQGEGIHYMLGLPRPS